MMRNDDQKRYAFQDYVQMDPRIGELLIEAQAVRKAEGRSFCANRVWYGNGVSGLKSKVCQLVGYGRGLGPCELQTSAAYDVVYEKVYSALPDCDQCNCCF